MPTVAELKKGSEYPNIQDLVKFNKTFIPFVLLEYDFSYNQLVTNSYPKRAHGIIVQ